MVNLRHSQTKRLGERILKKGYQKYMQERSCGNMNAGHVKYKRKLEIVNVK